ncbi:EI24 domain-containing protein [Microbacterium sp. 18062]|uniref:EI24 domain-containing protein n=1 Tax=Microbacterium sp. 18062 TaxID=2681410 RepID=UPI001F29D954|nr:EI24 domain-containing protein [Microbacterium sp. 18062]
MSAAPSAGREFLRGARTLLGGFGWWRVRPGLMLLGLVPAAIVSLVLGAGLVTLGAWIVPLTDALTPFTDGWPGLWATLLRIAVGTAVFGAALLLAATLFTALTLLIGEPFYDRIWRGVERVETGLAPDRDPGFWAGVADAISLIVRGVLAALLAFAIGLVPLVGGALGAVTGVALSGWILADELSARALNARGIGHRERRRLLRAHRARALGFGVATQLCFLIPLGAVLTMPAAVVGAARLAHGVLPPASEPRDMADSEA